MVMRKMKEEISNVTLKVGYKIKAFKVKIMMAIRKMKEGITNATLKVKEKVNELV